MSAFRSAQTRAVLAAVFLVFAYAALILTHRGEYWPFSVFPMYSRGMDFWSRPILLTVDDGESDWGDMTLETLPGEVLSMFEPGILRSQLREVFEQTEAWDSAGIQGLRPLIGEENIRGRRVLVVDVHGTLLPGAGVEIVALPLAVFTADSTSFSPRHLGQSR